MEAITRLSRTHLALEVPISETAHVGRGREDTPVKQHQGKAWATKAQQD
jgi:hypothetical protein